METILTFTLGVFVGMAFKGKLTIGLINVNKEADTACGRNQTTDNIQ
jgi:hypothetical protein